MYGLKPVPFPLKVLPCYKHFGGLVRSQFLFRALELMWVLIMSGIGTLKKDNRRSFGFAQNDSAGLGFVFPSPKIQTSTH